MLPTAMRIPFLALIAAFLTACSAPDGAPLASDSGSSDGAMDAGQDAGTDAAASIDSSMPDASIADASSQDAAVDAAPVCECSSGPCCDGCHVLPSTTICSDVYVSSMCTSLPGSMTVAWTTTSRRFCDGVTTGCTSTPVTVSTPDYCNMQAGMVCRTLTGKALCM